MLKNSQQRPGRFSFLYSFPVRFRVAAACIGIALLACFPMLPTGAQQPQDGEDGQAKKEEAGEKDGQNKPLLSYGADASRFLTVLQTDKPIYREKEKLRIRGVLLDHAKRTLLPNDAMKNMPPGAGVVEILGPKKDSVAQLAFRIEGGVWGVEWEVPEGASGGQYTLSVKYPLLGFPPVEKQVDIRSYRAPRLNTQIKFMRDGYGPGDTVAATLEVSRAAGGIPSGAAVTVTARVDGQVVYEGKATVDADGFCHTRFDLPEKIARGEGTLNMAINDGSDVEAANKTIPILLQAVDMNFYPEGGDLVEGVKSRVYFEAFTPAGKPADLAGVIVDDQGEQVGEFRSEHEGRGRFSFTPAAGRSYQAKVTEPAGITEPVSLPKAAGAGIVLQASQEVYEQDESIQLMIASATSQDVKVVVRKRDHEVATKEFSCGAELSAVTLNIGDQPHVDGVLVVTVYNEQGAAKAERLIYRKPNRAVAIKLTPESGTGFVPGGKVRLKVETTDEEGEPLSAVVGLTVTDQSVLEMVDRREQSATLPVAVLLEPEVKELADAHVYLDESNPQASAAVDLLLGVQGWRRFAAVDPIEWLKSHKDSKDALRRAFAIGAPMLNPATWAGAKKGNRNLLRFSDFDDHFGADPFAIRRKERLFAALEKAVDKSKAEPAAPEAPALGIREEEDGAEIEENLKLAAPKDEALARANRPDAGPAPANQPAPAAAAKPRADNQAGGGFGGDIRFRRQAQAREMRELDLADRLGGKRDMGWAEGFFQQMAAPISVRVYQYQVRPNRKPNERIDFTETLYWNVALKTDEKGVAHIEFGLNDSVTSFRAAADAVDGRGAIGAASTLVESIEPFYLEPKLPLEVSMGDMIQTPLGIVNATTSELADVKVAVETEGLDGKAKIAPFRLGPDGRVRKRVNIHVGDFVGEASLTLRGMAGDYSDQVTRKLRVAPLGFPYEQGSGGLLAPGGIVGTQVDIPKDYVPGSITATASVYPTPLASMTKSLERLIREPYGCFEQTSSTTYPLVMAQQYFLSHQNVEPNLVERSAALLDKGYDRLVGFESPSGGFEWFGGDPGHDALTAYGLMEFTDMSVVRNVDEAMLKRTREWLLAQRDGKGGFQRKTRTLHTWLAEPEVAYSYDTWALLRAGVDAAKLKKEVEWVVNVAEKTNNTYVIALGANVAQWGGDENAAKRLLDKLSGLQEPNGSMKGATVSVVGSGGESLTIETTALAMLAWMQDQSHVDQVEKGIKYLAEVCKGGRFGSTQSTVLALHSIVEYDAMRAVPKEPGSVTLWVDGQRVGEVKKFGSNTTGVIEMGDFADSLEPGKHQVELRMAGGGSPMPCTIQWSFNALTPDSSDQCKLDLEVSLADTKLREGGITDMEVVVVNRSEKEVPTPTAIIGIPGGLEVRHDQLKEIVKEGKIAAYEVRGRELILYWRVMDAEQRVRVPVSLVAAIPGKYTGPSSRAYLYYTDEHKDWTPGITVTIQPALGGKK